MARNLRDFLGAATFGIGLQGNKTIAAVELEPDGGVTVYVAAADPMRGPRINVYPVGGSASASPSGSRVTYIIGGVHS